MGKSQERGRVAKSAFNAMNQSMKIWHSVFGLALAASVPTSAQADDWGCTVALCLASVTDPFEIDECATALLQIRPWKSPFCSESGYDFDPPERVDLVCSIEDEEELRGAVDQVRMVEDEFGRPSLTRQTVCVDSEGRARSGGGIEGYRIRYRDEQGLEHTRFIEAE